MDVETELLYHLGEKGLWGRLVKAKQWQHMLVLSVLYLPVDHTRTELPFSVFSVDPALLKSIQMHSYFMLLCFFF